MSKVVATTVLPEDSGEVLTLGDTGDAIAISGDSLNLNNLQDAGGNNIITSDGAGNLTVNSAFGGAMNLLTTNTFTDAASSSFTSLIDSTYNVYIFTFIDINPATDDADFSFQANAAGASGYNETITSTWFRAYHNEDDGASGVAYHTGSDQAQGTAFQKITNSGNGADESIAGELHLFNPASTTYVKNFYFRSNSYNASNVSIDAFGAGYFNTTTAIDDIQFKMSSGNMDGIIKMYGISKS